MSSDRRKAESMSKQIFKKLIRRKFNKQIFHNEETCSICLSEYKENEEVVPLPCDIRHYFHEECIINWIEK